LTQKADLRRHWLSIRNAISKERRKQAADALSLFFTQYFTLINTQGFVLSFSSFGSEIEMHLLNQWLSEKKRLLLPKVEEKKLRIYQVNNLEKLIPSKFGMLEPDPTQCSQILFEDIQTITILVPGLAFDAALHRLGYGQGHYDCLLIEIPHYSIGVAFNEQKTDRLQIDSWDISLDEVLYF
jgi:5-formyltetrahydrofolate cyclo-ligase